MGEAKRRKKLDPNFGKNPSPKKAQLDLELFEKYLDLPLSEYSEPLHANLVEKGNKLPQLAHAEVGVFSSPRLSNKFS
jgi:hypothetical protein